MLSHSTVELRDIVVPQAELLPFDAHPEDGNARAIYHVVYIYCMSGGWRRWIFSLLTAPVPFFNALVWFSG